MKIFAFYSLVHEKIVLTFLKKFLFSPLTYLCKLESSWPKDIIITFLNNQILLFINYCAIYQLHFVLPVFNKRTNYVHSYVKDYRISLKTLSI